MAGLGFKAAWDFGRAVAGLARGGESARSATVTSVDEDGTVWVRMAGAVSEVPLDGTLASAQVGDTVTVGWRGGAPAGEGNASDPSAGGRSVSVVRESARAAQAVAQEAQAVADAIGQHFWADGSGVHVTEAENDPTTEHNILINSLGILLRKALNPLVSITQSAIAFYDGAGSAAANVVASFGTSGAQIGKASANHLSIGSSGMEILDGGTSRAFFGSTARIGATAAPHVNVNSTGMQVYADASTKTAEIAAQNNVSYLRLVDNQRYVSASTSGSGTNTKDLLTLGSYGTNNGHHAGIRLIASGTNGQAVLRLHDDESVSSGSVDLTPTALYVGSGIATHLEGGAYITGSAEVYGSLALGTPLSAASGGTGSDGFGSIETDDISTAVSLTTATWTAIGSVALSSGDWIVSYNAYFASNATGRRGMLIHTTADATSAASLRQGGVEVMAVSGGVTMLNGCRVLHLTATNTTYYLNVMQSSGADLNVTGYIRAFRLK